MIRRNGFLKQGAFVLLTFRFDELLFQLRNCAIGKLTRLLEFTVALRNGKSVACLFKLALEIGGKPELDRKSVV